MAYARKQDLNGLLSALDLRARRGFPPADALKEALNELTRAKYRHRTDTTAVSQSWQSLQRALKVDRPGLVPSLLGARAQALPPLNPFFDDTHIPHSEREQT
jgi:hypothetical protein